MFCYDTCELPHCVDYLAVDKCCTQSRAAKEPGLGVMTVISLFLVMNVSPKLLHASENLHAIVNAVLHVLFEGSVEVYPQQSSASVTLTRVTNNRIHSHVNETTCILEAGSVA